MANENIGVIKCPFTGRLSVVRADCRGKKYYYSTAGKITPAPAPGQRFINENMMPLENFIVNQTAPGYPPEVEPLTAQAAPERQEIPLTEKTGKSKSFLEAFLGD